MGFGYWLSRSLKTLFCICFYYCSLFISGFLLYPRGDFLDLSRGEKLATSLGLSTIIVFFLFSVVVLVNRLVHKKTWFSQYSITFSYFVFCLSHFIFLYFMNKMIGVDFIIHSIIAVVFLIISIVMGKLCIKEKDIVCLE